MSHDQQEPDDDANDLFSEMYRRQLSALILAAEKIVRSSTLAEDMAQDAFLRLYHGKKWQEYPRDCLERVLFKTCYNLCIDWWRSQSAMQRAGEQLSLLNELPSHEQDDTYDAIRNLLCEQMDQLSEGERQILLMRFIERLPSREIARRLGLTVKAVDCRWSRLTKKLRQASAASRENDFLFQC